MPPATMLPPSDQGLTMGPSSSYSIPARRKTPSELRQEQLKRNVRLRTASEGESGALPFQGSATESKKVTPRLIDTRVADIFAATKPHERPKFSSLKQMDDMVGHPPMPSAAIRRPTDQENRMPASGEMPGVDSYNCAAEGGVANHSVHAAHILNKFRDVTQMSTVAPLETSGSGLNMVEALKMMAPTSWGQGLNELATKPVGLANGQNVLVHDDHTTLLKSKTPPVDFSLKLSARFLSADSLHWCHRTTVSNETEGLSKFVRRLEERNKENVDSQVEECAEKQILKRFGAQFCKALFSWIHPSPQYSGLYDLALTSSRGDSRKDPQLTALYQMWEDAFTSLYYMFHHRVCNQFYFCTQQFVVMFVGGNVAGRDHNSSNAYWSRSTRGLRRLLREQGVEFLMPYSSPEADTTTMEELQELTEFEQLHPGQTRVMDSSSVMDNSPQSVLVFKGKNVHRLFDFLLNYRFVVGSANAKEIPVLYSPVEFKTATLHAPEIKCKRAEYDSSARNQLAGSMTGRMKGTNVPEMMYSLEVKDAYGAYIPPWVVQGVCRVLEESQSTGFEVSFNTGPLSEVLNVAQKTPQSAAGICLTEIEREPKSRSGNAILIKDITAEIQQCKQKMVKQLKFAEGFYELSVKDSR
ncbi:protein downstream neighbor of Son [Marchantia polymorpha subsp. ruderalis]|uniref:Uncharacterized protein n=2 Tax=Marchantia polymorpha TaxID=3197 RepID=A0A176W772_MARPO|nr:hypothetical protein AXG93_3036s1070 [Marchantia polymorpha subsp. ruderalis]PTQ46353.1 hypothetical protein MARPO_0011s0047 [Marchantia polymorpha]BBN08317.1 hypothetical protein Mp_4g10610 [Marchantia polymorpha subsp. ruderalis]|eukprot:PTQ46353.1 hypothetical protein MARPO_0011s0047 [Marchantia polymorpha]